MLKKNKLVSFLLLFLIPIFHVSGNCESFGKEIYNYESGGEDEIIQNDFIIRRKVLFDSHPVGAYTDAMFKRDWTAPFRDLFQPNTTQIQQVDGRRCLTNFYPEGTWGRGGGLNQMAPFESPDNIEEIYITYKLKFDQNFDFALGGKLPGVAFGSAQNVASGGAGPDIGNKGASLRLMWASEGRLIMYVYHHSMTSKYGDQLGLGRFAQINKGQWHTLTIRVVANEIGKANGIMQVWLDEKLVASSSKIEMRTSSSPRTIREIMLNTFMGGASKIFAAERDQYLWMNDFYFWQYSKEFLSNNPNVARGLTLHTTNHLLYTPLSEKKQNETVNSKLILTPFPAAGGKVSVKTGTN